MINAFALFKECGPGSRRNSAGSGHTISKRFFHSLSPWPEDHKRDRELIQKAVKSREKGSYEQKFLCPDGSMGYYFSTFQGIYDDDGDLIAIQGTVA
jgi:PAS fold